jgi:ADP-heptose:LPS heptosyltransferase
MTYNRMAKNLEWARYNYDMVFDLSNSIEKMYCVNENDWRYYTPDSFRRGKLGNISYYDVMTKFVGLPDSYLGTRGQLYYTEEEHRLAKEWGDKKRESYSHVILMNLSGSTPHKKFVQAEQVARKLLDVLPHALLIITGDNHCTDQVFEHGRVISYVGSSNGFRSVALKCKYVDLTISLESGLPLVAHSWDAPCLQLLTAASPENHCKYAKNAYWIQAKVPCSPCHKNPREYFGCPIEERMPACVWFDVDEVVEKARSILVGS